MVVKGQHSVRPGDCTGCQGPAPCVKGTALAVKGQHSCGVSMGLHWLPTANTPVCPGDCVKGQHSCVSRGLCQGTELLCVSSGLHWLSRSNTPVSRGLSRASTPVCVQGTVSRDSTPVCVQWTALAVKVQHPCVSRGLHCLSRASTPVCPGDCTGCQGQIPCVCPGDCTGCQGQIPCVCPGDCTGCQAQIPCVCPGDCTGCQGQTPLCVSRGLHLTSRASTPGDCTGRQGPTPLWGSR